MPNHYKPKYKKWLKSNQVIFNTYPNRLEKNNKQKWNNFKQKNFPINLKHPISFESKIRLESEKTLFKKYLIQKQTLKAFYGNISEKQFKKLIKKSNLYNSKSSKSLIGLLESRLDICLYRMHFAKTLDEARQLISHRKIYVNGNCVMSKSYSLASGDLIQLKNENLDVHYKNYLNLLKKKTLNTQKEDSLKFVSIPHIQIDPKTMSAIFLYQPKVDEVFFPFNINLKNIKEFYQI